MKIKKKHVFYVFLGIFGILTVILSNFVNTTQNTVPNNVLTLHENNSSFIVEIKGEVIKPGIYHVPNNTRLFEIIQIAGGLTKQADIASLNLAQSLFDGQSIVIPFRENLQENNQNISKISINSASAAELVKLTGIGDARANAIIAYRNSHGGFSKLEDLMKVSGISEAIFNQIKDDIRL